MFVLAVYVYLNLLTYLYFILVLGVCSNNRLILLIAETLVAFIIFIFLGSTSFWSTLLRKIQYVSGKTMLVLLWGMKLRDEQIFPSIA